MHPGSCLVDFDPSCTALEASCWHVNLNLRKLCITSFSNHAFVCNKPHCHFYDCAWAICRSFKFPVAFCIHRLFMSLEVETFWWWIFHLLGAYLLYSPCTQLIHHWLTVMTILAAWNASTSPLRHITHCLGLASTLYGQLTLMQISIMVTSMVSS